ncbi:MAG TPA: fibronectin type III domain-containing protein, partial [Acidimicrobiales bacterium]
TSASSRIPSGSTVSFSQSTQMFGFNSTAAIPACSAVSNWSAPVASGGSWTSTATCSTSESSSGTGAFSATYSGGDDTSSSQANLGQTNTLVPSHSVGADSQTNAGGCSNCYYGESSAPDAEGDAFVKGSLSGQLAVGTANDVVITGNLKYADCSGKWIIGQSGEPQSFCPYSAGGINDSLGLVAHNYVEVNHPVTNGGGSVLAPCGSASGVLCDPSNSGGGLTIDAAILAVTQSFVVNNYAAGNGEGQLAIYGSLQQFARGPVGTFNGNSSVSGYVKHYTWDPLLDFLAPPDYLVPSTNSWGLGAVDTTAGAGSTSVCPPLSGVYAGTDTNGVIQDGPAVTRYCSASSGGLPNYPSITAPSPPTGVSVSAVGPSDVSVSWIAPAWDGASPVTGYVVTPYLDGTTAQAPLTFPSAATTELVTGLDPNFNYSFKVAAVNALGTSDISSASATIRG